MNQFIIEFFSSNTTLIQSTSGTTGAPTQFSLDRSAMVRSARQTISHFGLLPGNSALLCLPVQYIAGKMMVVRALVGGLNLIAVEPSGRPLRHFDLPIDFAAMVPLQLHESLQHHDTLNRIGTLLLGGGAVDEVLRQQIRQLERPEVYETFGMSESYTHFAVKRLNGEAEEYFTILPGVAIRVDERGCLVVDVPGVTNGEVVTNDLVRLIGTDRFSWLGRIDHVISSGGMKVIPEVLEEKIRAVLGVELLVVGVPEPRLGEKIVLVVEGTEGKAAREEWLGRMRAVLDKHEMPKEIVMMENIPRNRSMKQDRLAVVQRLTEAEKKGRRG